MCSDNGNLRRGQSRQGGDGGICVGHVHRGDFVALVGHSGVCDNCAHLHFEVRTSCDFYSTNMTGCRVVDPYGWEWPTADPIVNNSHGTTHPLLWDIGRWGLTVPQVNGVQISVNGSNWTVTINGAGFDPQRPNVTLWHLNGLYCFGCGGSQCGDAQSWVATVTIQSATPSQIIAGVQISNSPPNPAPSPDLTVVKVSNWYGPRSTGTLPGTLSAYSLQLFGQPAPGGGVFLGFGGFHSATDDGQVIFNSGVDLNGDGIPDGYYDFSSSSAGMAKVSVTGFTPIFNTVMNNKGDQAFSGINQGGGQHVAGIYLLPAGNASPTKVALPGDPCPAPCPVSGPPVIEGVWGPYAIGQNGEVVFSAELPGTQPTPTWILYLYSPTDGSYTKIAADGSGGDITPVGGYFTSQNFYGSVGIIPSPGDVIFSDLVTGGSSTSGIFKYSRSTKALSRIVVQGDQVPSGRTGTLEMPLGSTQGSRLVFYSTVDGGNTHQIIGTVPDVTVSNPRSQLVAYQGKATGTIAGGTFDTSDSSHLPFAFFGEGLGVPEARSGGSIVFSSQLVDAVSSDGSPTDAGLFLWDGATMTKIVVNGDPLSSGYHLAGVVQFVVDNVGNTYYFATREN
jgi:hypothetical protein